MQSLIADTLKAWREAERVLLGLSPTAPEHDTVRRMVIELRAMYSKLSEPFDISEDTIASAHALLRTAAALFQSIRGEPAS